MPILDVVLFAKDCLRNRGGLAEKEPPLSKAVEVSPGIQLAAIDDEVAHVVFHACKFRELEVGGDEILYGLIRENPPGNDWDADRQISKALYLSHFLHPHQGGFEFAARIVVSEKKQVTDLTRFDLIPAYTRAFPCQGVARRWLTQEEGDELPKLISAYDAATEFLKDKRLGMAVSQFSDVPFIYQGRPRISLLAAILEGLVSSRPDRAVKQFVVRVAALAGEVGLDRFDRKWADRLYKLRSRLAHGSPLFQSPERSDRDTMANELATAMREMEELLRKIIRTALLDRKFAQRVDDVDRHWPVPGKGCAKCRSDDGDLLAVQCPKCGQPWEEA